MRVIGDIVRLGAKRHPVRTAVIMGERRMSFAELDRSSEQIAAALRKRGVGEGDRVAMMAENCTEFLEAAFGVLQSGATLVPLNFRYGPQELDFVIADVAPSVVFAGSGYVNPVAQSLERSGVSADLVALHDNGPAGLTAFRIAAASPTKIDPRSAATILYTSGTTGRPKGVVATHEATMRLLPAYGIEGDLSRDDVMLICMPLFHGGGLVIQALSALYFGTTVVLSGKGFDPASVLRTVRDENVTITLWTPTMLAMLTRMEERDPCDIRTIWYGSSSITGQVLDRARRMFPQASFHQWYGTTEATSLAILRHEDHVSHPRSTGREILPADLRIIDEDGGDVPPGGTGEIIAAATGTVMTGYHNNLEATTATIRDGWLHTGDIAMVDGGGYFTIIGRSSDLIVTGGENVYPTEIEEVLLEHPAVADVAVFGLPDEIYGEVVTAAIVAAEPVDADDLRELVGSRLSRYKIPRVVHAVESLPRNASGKVLRRELVSRFASDAGTTR